MFDSDTQGFYKSEQQESSIMRRSFNPHALQRSAPLLHVGAVYHHEFQSTRPMRGATTLDDLRGSGSLVSIHAPHAGRDPRIITGKHHRKVSIHAPRVGRDPQYFSHAIASLLFQSTRPVWGATFLLCATVGWRKFQSTRPVWGATLEGCLRRRCCTVSIHAPRVGRDARTI